MTSSKEERDMVESYNSGVNSYIQKPVDFDQFRGTVKTLGMSVDGREPAAHQPRRAGTQQERPMSVDHGRGSPHLRSNAKRMLEASLPPG